MNLQLESTYRQRTTQELRIQMMDEHPEHHQGQQTRGRRGGRMHGGRVQRPKRWRRQGQRRTSDEIRDTTEDHVVNHGLQWLKGAAKYSEIDRILNTSNISEREQVSQPTCNVLLYSLLVVMIHKQVSICILQHTANIQRQTATHKHTRVVLFKYICVCALFSVLCKNYVFCISAGQQDYLIVVAADPFSHLNRRRPFAPWSEQTMSFV